MMKSIGGIYYGWIVAAAACFCFGLGYGPAFFSFGNFFLHIELELGYTRADLGMIFGTFMFCFTGSALIVGALQNRFGIRNIIIVGSFIAAVGFFATSQIHSKLGFLIWFSLFGGLGIGFSTLVPCQTLGQSWFKKRRSLVFALIYSTPFLLAPVVTRWARWMMDFGESGWRIGWVVIGCMSLSVAFVAYIFIKDRPEDIGLLPDGECHPAPDRDMKQHEQVQWTGAEAIRTPQFLFITMGTIAFVLPWVVLLSQGPSHISDQGIDPDALSFLVGMAGWSAVIGQFTGAFGDRVSPRLVAAVALVLEGVGIAGFFFAHDAKFVFLCVFLIAFGYGACRVAIAQILATYFGRDAFATTSGVRIAITAIFAAAAPFVAGICYDRFDSYFAPFIAFSIVCLVGAFAIAISKHPGQPDRPAAEA